MKLGWALLVVLARTTGQPPPDLVSPDRFTLTLWTDVPPASGASGASGATTDGAITVSIERRFAPLGVDRLYTLVQAGFYNSSAFTRVAPNFGVQFGVSKRMDQWRNAEIDDDPVLLNNTRGTVVFATAGPNARTTQVFINTKDNPFLNTRRFAAFGLIVGGYDVVTRIHNPTPGQTDGVSQHDYALGGDSWARQEYPGINFVVGATVTPTTVAPTTTPTTIAPTTARPPPPPNNGGESRGFGKAHTSVIVSCSVVVAIMVAAAVVAKRMGGASTRGSHGYAQLEQSANFDTDDDVELLDVAALGCSAAVDDADVDDTLRPLGSGVVDRARCDPAAHLPVELMAKILAEVGRRSLYLHVPAVSRRWRKLCRHWIRVSVDMGWARLGGFVDGGGVGGPGVLSCKVTDAGLIAIVSRFSVVHTANLAFCVRITDDALRAIAGLCPLLTECELIGCRAITHRGLEAIAVGCPAVYGMAELAKMAKRLSVKAVFKYQLDWEAGRYGNHIGPNVSRDTVVI